MRALISFPCKFLHARCPNTCQRETSHKAYYCWDFDFFFVIPPIPWNCWNAHLDHHLEFAVNVTVKAQSWEPSQRVKRVYKKETPRSITQNETKKSNNYTPIICWSISVASLAFHSFLFHNMSSIVSLWFEIGTRTNKTHTVEMNQVWKKNKTRTINAYTLFPSDLKLAQRQTKSIPWRWIKSEKK